MHSTPERERERGWGGWDGWWRKLLNEWWFIINSGAKVCSFARETASAAGGGYQKCRQTIECDGTRNCSRRYDERAMMAMVMMMIVVVVYCSDVNWILIRFLFCGHPQHSFIRSHSGLSYFSSRSSSILLAVHLQGCSFPFPIVCRWYYDVKIPKTRFITVLELISSLFYFPSSPVPITHGPLERWGAKKKQM